VRTPAEILSEAHTIALVGASPEARAIAEGAGVDYVEDACTAIVHRAMVAT
jgi:predicted CoA-binding protein